LAAQLGNSIHPRHHLFIRSAARGDSIAATLFLHSAGSVTAPTFLHLFGRCIDCRATIFSAGRPISSPRHNLFSGPANPIATLQSFQRAGKSYRRAAIISAGRRIPLPRRNLFHRPANLIAMPQSFQRAGKPNRFRGLAHSIAKPPNLISAGASSSCLLYHSNSI
jgi:hypothetical protein